jgi:hypothetical protein
MLDQEEEAEPTEDEAQAEYNRFMCDMNRRPIEDYFLDQDSETEMEIF